MFETERLILRPWIPEEDAIQAFAIYGNAEVMGFIRPPEKTIEAVRLKLKEDIERSRACNNGTGTWAVIEKANHEILGAVLLKQLPDN
ncbi:MAG: GNAT family N-acetyltransferase, partial [Halothece sp.]